MKWARRWFLCGALMACCTGGIGGLELKCGADHNCNMLPDMSDRSNMRHLKCGACQLAAVQLAHTVMKKEAKIKKPLREGDAAALLEGFCEHGALHRAPFFRRCGCLQQHAIQRRIVRVHHCVAAHFPRMACEHTHMRVLKLHACTHAPDIAEYGLQLDSNGVPMASFTNDITLNRATGGWVKRTLMVPLTLPFV